MTNLIASLHGHIYVSFPKENCTTINIIQIIKSLTYLKTIKRLFAN